MWFLYIIAVIILGPIAYGFFVKDFPGILPWFAVTAFILVLFIKLRVSVENIFSYIIWLIAYVILGLGIYKGMQQESIIPVIFTGVCAFVVFVLGTNVYAPDTQQISYKKVVKNPSYEPAEFYNPYTKEYIKPKRNYEINEVDSITGKNVSYDKVILVGVYLSNSDRLDAFIYNHSYRISVGDKIEVPCDRETVSVIVQKIGIVDKENLPYNIYSYKKVLGIVEYRKYNSIQYNSSYDDPNTVDSYNVYDNTYDDWRGI